MRQITLALCASAALVACGPQESTPAAYDPTLLASYRAALPASQQLEARVPDNTGAAVGDPAAYPNFSKDIVLGINGNVRRIVETMRFIADQEPTAWNSDTKEFFWGPFPNNNGFGTFAAYIRENPAGADFQYAYALLRGASNDVTSFRPVIWGGATPDADGDPDHGVGVTLWDFEANHAFEQAFDPAYATRTYTRGRFAAAYMAGADTNTPGAEVGLVLAYIRGFADNVAANTTPVETGNLDYFYGRFIAPDQNRYDWVDYLLHADIDNNATADLPEDVAVQLVFLNGGHGRAEATASGGDIPAGQSFIASECWDNTVSRTYLEGIAYNGTTQQGAAYIEGSENNCGLIFEAGLDALSLPGLADVDPGIAAALAGVAENGVPQGS